MQDQSQERHTTYNVPLGGAESVHAEVSMPGGRFKLGGGATDLLEAEFIFGDDKWAPEVDYDVHGKRGNLIVRQSSEWWWMPWAAARNRWDLRLNNFVPIHLSLNVGGGESDIDLSGLTLDAVDVRAGAGELRVNLTGHPSLTRLDVSLGVGRATIDLAGHWSKNLRATINAGVGETTVRLPSDVGVRVKLRRGLGSISTFDLMQSGGDYVNAAYGKSPVTLDVEVVSGVGALSLTVVK